MIIFFRITEARSTHVQLFNFAIITKAARLNMIYIPTTQPFVSILFFYFSASQSSNGLGRMESIDGLINSLSASMPSQLRIDTSSIPGQALGVFSSAWIKQGTKMGPFTGRHVTTDEQIKHNSKFVWEVKSINRMWRLFGRILHE